MKAKKFNEFTSEAYHIITHDKTDIWISDKAYKRLKKGKDVVGYTEDKYEGGHKDVWVFKDDIDTIVKSKEGLADVVDMYAKFESKNNMRTKKFDEFVNESSNMRTLRGFLKELKKEYGLTPSEQSLADFIYNNYEEVTGEKLEDSDPASNDHIADIVAHFKMDGEDFMIAWEDRTNESVNEKVKLIMRNILSKMVPAAFGPTTSPKMREEIRDAVEAAIEPILTKYNYVVESELHEKNFQVVVGDEAIEYTLRENLAGDGIIAMASSSKDLDKEIESGASKTAIAKDIEDNINSRLKRMRQDITVSIDYRHDGAGYGFKLNLDGLLQKLNK